MHHSRFLSRVLTLFTKSLPLDVGARLWDNILLEGDMFIVRACLGLLRLLQKRLLASSYDQVLISLTHLPDVRRTLFWLDSVQFHSTQFD